MQSYGPPKSQESRLGEFHDSHLKVLGQNAIWMWASWRGIKYTIRGRWWLHSSPSRGESCEYKLPMVRPNTKSVAAPLWVKWEDETPTPKVGDLESSGTLECLEFDSKAQNTSHWGVLDVIGKVSKRRYRKWPRIGHLDICSPSYGQKKGRESNWQFDSRPLKVGNRPLPDLRIESTTWRWKDLDEGYIFSLDLVAIRLCSRELQAFKVLGLQPGQFRDSNLGVQGKRAIWM
jgi:hypothetical protein